MNKPELSIILPVYNVDKWLNECLLSIQAQTFQDWEAILVDDGATDFSGVMCDSWARRDDRFRVIHQDNAGVSAARNTGIDATEGSYLSFVDPDDYLSENFYEALISQMKAHDADYGSAPFSIVIGQVRSIGSDFFDTMFQQKKKGVYVGDEIILNMDKLITGGSWGQVFERDLWGNARFPVGVDLAEDVAVVPSVIAKAHTAVYVETATYFYRKRPGSLMAKHTDSDRLQSCFRMAEQMYSELCTINPKHKNKYAEMKFCLNLVRFHDYLRSGHGYNAKTALKIFAEYWNGV